jgi:hypothetical protein
MPTAVLLLGNHLMLIHKQCGPITVSLLSSHLMREMICMQCHGENKTTVSRSTGMYIYKMVTFYFWESTGIMYKIPVTLFVRFW